MWMFEVELENGTRVQAYKHIHTRRYAHLDQDGVGYVYEHPDRYAVVETPSLLRGVFSSMGGLLGVTEQQLRASFDAVEWLEEFACATEGTPTEV